MKKECEPTKSNRSNFIRGFLSREKDDASKKTTDSKIPKYNKKETKQDFLKFPVTKSSTFKVLGGRSASDGKTPLLTRLYNIGKAKKSFQRDKRDALILEDSVIDWKKINLFDDAEEGEFDGDFNAIHEMKRFLKKYKVR